MERRLYVAYGTWLCVLIWLSPVMTQPSPDEIMCYTCSSADYEQDYCSAKVFDPYNENVGSEKGCVMCKKVVRWDEGRSLTVRSCVRKGDVCQTGYETECCHVDFCNGRIADRRLETSDSATMRTGWTLSLVMSMVVVMS